MNKKEKAILYQIYSDCVYLKLRDELTEFGEGQLDVCKTLLNYKD
jgi:hypothetical protein